MRIGFDAKRAFQNDTGLGNYSRTLLQSVVKYFPTNQYFLFAPKLTEKFKINGILQLVAVEPKHWLHKKFSGAWRRKWVVDDLVKNKIDVYHGLSHRIPKGISKTKIPAVVTIHDLIFERFPHQYSFADRLIYRAQFKYACKHSRAIIAISEQTKQDIVNYYEIPSQKITVCYQSCDTRFKEKVAEEDKEKIRTLYNLPEKYFLYVGSIIERKNLLLICKALLLLKEKLFIPLVVIGRGGKYQNLVKDFIEKNNLEGSIIFLSENVEAKNHPSFKNSAHFPAIYQMSDALIYPSIFEGFGIPILEALCSGIPVLSSNASCLPEVGGDAALYFNPANEKELAKAMMQITDNENLRQSMIIKGLQQAELFSEEKTASAVMQVYKKIME
jgi:glycosyltransferase involved in cell wall biosynthesis